MQQSYYKEAVELVKNYKPIGAKLGQPIVIKPIDLSDAFNYHDEKEARVTADNKL
jgi:hypothetical protein